MVIGNLVRQIASLLLENAFFEAEQIVMKTLGINKTALITDSKKAVSDAEAQAAFDMAKRRNAGEPLQYILGECEFMSLPFYIEKGVLIPRSDTETLVETVISMADGQSEILDICCGSGCIGISLAHFIKGAKVNMLDISGSAVRLSEKNIKLNGVSDRAKVMTTDILSENPSGKYNIIVSNPPYIETNVIETLAPTVKDFEPRLALDGGADGLLFYRRIVSIAPSLLLSGGILAFEIGYNEGNAVKRLMEKDFKDIRIVKDLAGMDRVVVGVLAKG